MIGKRVFGGSDGRPDVALWTRPSPHGKVPALTDDGVTLYESSAIVEYLEERHSVPPLLPREPAARAAVRIEELK